MGHFGVRITWTVSFTAFFGHFWVHLVNIFWANYQIENNSNGGTEEIFGNDYEEPTSPDGPSNFDQYEFQETVRKGKNWFNAEHKSRMLMKKSFARGQCEISYLCPISGKRIQRAARGIQCYHASAFCLNSFLTRERIRKKSGLCPICKKEIKFR